MREQYSNPSHHPEQESTNELEPTALSKDLLRDYYQTFRLAQGELAIQPALFHFLALQHQKDGHQPIMPEALAIAEQELEHLLPPARHIATTEEMRNDNESGFRAVWNEYTNILSAEPAPYRGLELILDDMLAKDIKYQKQERPGRTEKQDPHESIVREYILGERLSGSPQLKEVRDMLRSTLLSPKDDSDDAQWMQERLETLIKDWEENHPQSSFLSPA